MKYFYPSDQQYIFTNRSLELATLEHLHHNLNNGLVEHAALFGLRRIGKTLLLKEFMRRLFEVPGNASPVYLDFSILCASPESFTCGYIGLICYWLLEEGKSDPGPFLYPSSLGPAVLRAGGALFYDAIQETLQELQLARPDRQKLLRQAFQFSRQASRIANKKLILLCDEFQEIRTLENFPNSQNTLSLFRSELQSQNDVLFLLAGSAVSVLSNLLSHSDSPLFAQFTKIEIGTFDRTNSRQMAKKLLSEPLEEDLYPLIHSFTNGHPFYLNAIIRRINYLIDVVQRNPSGEVVKQAFLVETLSPGGRIYDFCQYIYDLSLQKAKGYGVLKSILQILSREEGLTASEISRLIHVTPASASDYLRWLCEVDLLVQREKKYYYQDSVLRFWVANVIRGIEVSINTEPLDMDGLINRLDAQFQRASEELGHAQESRVRELMRLFQGQEVPGDIFHAKGTVRLPVVVQVKSQISKDGQVEIDAVAEGEKRWIVEIKWRSKRAGVKEIKKLFEVAQRINAIGWYISKAGFTSEAINFGQDHNIFLSDATGITDLFKWIKPARSL